MVLSVRFLVWTDIWTDVWTDIKKRNVLFGRTFGRTKSVKKTAIQGYKLPKIGMKMHDFDRFRGINFHILQVFTYI